MSPSPLDILIGLLAAPPPSNAFDLASMWHAMGPFAKAIACALAAMSAYSLGITVERLVTFARAHGASRRYVTQLRELLKAGQYAESTALGRQLRHGPLGRVLGQALEEYTRGGALRGGTPRSTSEDFDVVIEAVERSVDRATLRTVADLRRGLGALATIGSTAPFVGLLGTVAGIMSAFQSMAATGSGGLASVSAGIAEALVTTAFGLLVAIPSVMAFNHLTGKVEAFQVDIEDAANELIDFLVKAGPAPRSDGRP